MTRSLSVHAACSPLLVLALAAGCAAPGSTPDAGSPATTGASPSGAVSPSASPAAGPSGGGSPYPVRTGGPGDVAPNHVDNNGWKQRHELTKDERRAGEAIAARIRPALLALRAKEDFRPEATRQALLGLGYPARDVQVTPMRISALTGSTTPPPGAVYAVRFGQGGCVVGDVRPSRVLVEVTGAGAEFGCLEPFAH